MGIPCTCILHIVLLNCAATGSIPLFERMRVRVRRPAQCRHVARKKEEREKSLLYTYELLKRYLSRDPVRKLTVMR